FRLQSNLWLSVACWPPLFVLFRHVVSGGQVRLRRTPNSQPGATNGKPPLHRHDFASQRRILVLSGLNSYFWTVSGGIYFLAVVLCIGRKPRPPKPTPPEVLEYEAWVREQLAELYRERAERVETAFAPRHLLDTVAQKHRGFERWIQLLP